MPLRKSLGRIIGRDPKAKPEPPRDLVTRVDQVERRVTYLETQVKLLERVQS